jgi:FAD synthase
VETARGLERLERTDRPVFVVVGVFDGLHLGHAYLLEHLVREAAARDARPLVITFDHHPDEVITGSAPPLLCDPEERLALLDAAGVEATVVVHFDQRLRETTYDAFVAQVADRAPLAGFLMTPDAAFGYKRGGTPETLAALGAERGFEVVVVPPFELGGHPVRSSEVRTAIAAGDIALATRLVGRPHAVAGVTTAGWQGSVVTFELPMALPPDGAWDVAIAVGPRVRWRARGRRGSSGHPRPGRIPRPVRGRLTRANRRDTGRIRCRSRQVCDKVAQNPSNGFARGPRGLRAEEAAR